MRYLPLFKNVDGRACLVVGGGPVAQRKIQMLLRAKAAVTVVAPDATEEIRGWNETGRVVWTERRFHPKDIAGRVLVFYFGAVDPAQVIADLELLEASPAERRRAATPFEGRWLRAEPTSADLGFFERQFERRGLPQAAREFHVSRVERVRNRQWLIYNFIFVESVMKYF